MNNNQISEYERCWICLNNDQTSELVQSCSCPRLSHSECLARWQYYRYGTREETHCRFCGMRLKSWRLVLPELRGTERLFISEAQRRFNIYTVILSLQISIIAVHLVICNAPKHIHISNYCSSVFERWYCFCILVWLSFFRFSYLAHIILINN